MQASTAENHRVVAPCEACHRLACPLVSLGEQAQRHRVTVLARGERPEPSPPDMLRLCVVCDGLLALAAGLPDGRRQIVELDTPGDFICVGENSDRAMWVEALTGSLLCEMDFKASEARRGDFLNRLFGITHSKLACSAGRMVALGRLDGNERVSGFLADMASRIGLMQQGAWHLHLPMSREDIADYLGLNAETVSRILGRLKKAGLVRFVTPTELMLPDLAALEARGTGGWAPRVPQVMVEAAP